MGQSQVDQLTHTQPAREQHFNDGAVAVTLPLAKVDGRFELIHLGCAEHFGQVLAQLWRLQQLGGVVVAEAVEQQKAVERAYTAQNAAL